MENRRSIYYRGNTVKPPKIKKEYRDAVRSHKLGETFKAEIKNKFSQKVCATSKCLWCGHNFNNEYRIRCPRCENCQFCGFRMETINGCLVCGNKSSDEINIKYKKRKIL